MFVCCHLQCDDVSRLETQVKITRTFVDAVEVREAGFREVNEALQGSEMWAGSKALPEAPTKYQEKAKVKFTSIALQLLHLGDVKFLPC